MLKNQHKWRLAPKGVLMAAPALLLLFSLALPREQPAARLDLRGLLSSARGVPPALCLLAADGIATGGWGHGLDAPAVPVSSDVRARLRALRWTTLPADEAGVLMGGLGAADNCERHLAATLLGHSESRSLAGAVGQRLASAAAPERSAALLALGLMEAKTQVDAVVRVMHDASTDVRANAAWALGRIGVSTTA